jgi:SAM-dependent methyltransferase
VGGFAAVLGPLSLDYPKPTLAGGDFLCGAVRQYRAQFRSRRGHRRIRIRDVDDYRAASLQGWSSVAGDWAELIERIDRQLHAGSDWMLDAVALCPGERVLELAGGPGTVSILAAQRVGPEGTVLHSDFAEPMVQAASERFRSEGVEIESRVIDAESIDLPDGSVDVVLCRMGFMLMADPATALRESARVLAPGGRLALAVWTDAPSNPWAAVAMQAVAAELNAPPPPPDAPGMWSLGDRARVEKVLVDAGFGELRIEVLEDAVEFDSAQQFVEATRRLAGPLRALFANLEEPQREAIERRIFELVAPFEQSDGRLKMPEQMLVAYGRR